MSYAIKIDHFEGPLDLLLQLVESAELDITKVSLLEVTEPFVKHVEANRGKIPPEELADFLVVAAKLVYLKSKALLPDLHDPSLEEGPDLESQLRMYKVFVEAAKQLGTRWLEGKSMYGRLSRPVKQTEPVFAPPTGVDGQTLKDLFQKAIRRIEPILSLPKAAIERVVTIEEKISTLHARVRQMMRVSFHRFLAESQDRAEMVVGFLALLELIKQKSVTVEQNELFSDIQLQHAE
ncbi:segregation/condensation protein A [Candidatus Uhrbacteria bacterium]|nr:segregation/condensation protein A [Candidatus Uhrbacteria bacterium]